MDDKFLEEQLGRLKNEIPVNQELKKNLRQSFVQQRQKKRRIRFSIALVAVAACLVFLIYAVFPLSFVEKANAAALKIFNQISFVDIGGGQNLGVAEYDGTIYIPVAGKGLFAYNQKGLHILFNEEVGFVRTSSNGSKLVLSARGNLMIYDLAKDEIREILSGDNVSTYYEQPSWSPDNQRIIYTKKVIARKEPHGFTVKESGIYEIDLKSLSISSKLADGEYPSYVKGREEIIYERDGKVISKNLTDGSEKVIDTGRFPSVSPNGEYVAYVKTERKMRDLAPNASVGENLNNVWIADVNLATKKQVTANFLIRSIDEQEWLKGLKPSSVSQVLEFSGMYDYYDPVWDSDSDSLFVLKNRNMEGGPMRLVRIDFTTEKMTTEDIVRKYLQALVTRDDDYAKSLMKNSPEILTISNPHPVGYKVMGTGEENGRKYVEAELNFAYTADAYYAVKKSRYYVSPNDNGYIIDNIIDLGGVEVYSKDGKTVAFLQGEKEDILFTVSDIPQAYLPGGKYRLSSLAYYEQTNTIVFTVQAMQDQGQKAMVNILSYNLSKKTFRLVDTVKIINGQDNIGVESLIIDDKGQYIALNLFSDNNRVYRSYVRVYDLKTGRKIDLNSLLESIQIETMRTNFWDEGNLVIGVTSYEQTMRYIYQPTEQKLYSY
ncbi:MAG: peptidase S9 [Bacillota bacterium]